METNNKVYSQLLAKAAANAGISSDSWTWCLRTNSTFFDCPINEQPDENSFVLAVHNPAMIGESMFQIPVKHGNYSVSVYNHDSDKFRPLQ